MLNPATLLIVGLITGVGGAATYATFHYAERSGKLTLTDLLPAPPPRPPLPRFLYKESQNETLHR